MNPSALEFVFTAIAAAAEKGERCPSAEELRDGMARAGVRGGHPSALTTALARQGRIVVTVHANNFRVAEICGSALRTRAPARWRPKLRIDTQGTSKVLYRRRLPAAVGAR